MEVDELPQAEPARTVASTDHVRDPMRLAIPAIASAAAAVLHAAAAGIHADHPTLSRLFVALAVAQGAAAVIGFVRGDLLASWMLVWVNLVAVAGWIVTRITGIEAIGGLEVAERPQLADSISAVLAAVAVAGAVAASSPRARAVPARAITNAAIVAGILVVPGLADATTHDHADHGDGAVAADGHDHGGDTAAATGADGAAAVADDAHAHTGIPSNGDVDGTLGNLLADQVGPVGDGAATGADHAHAWPRPWNPDTDPIDFSGVEGVAPEQQSRAEQLVSDTLRELPAFADVNAVGALGYESIGDAGTGFEHYVDYSLINDSTILDPTQPESLVYRVDGDQRILVSAMFIAGNTPVDDPELVAFGGPLMQWHVHQNLCWGLDENNQPKVVAVLEAPGDTCPALTVNAGAENPMVHVWIAPHECGPFAALEGHGAGQTAAAAGDRVDQCAHDHPTGTTDDPAAASIGTPYDPAKPIDLGGTPGVTDEQQAFAENLVAATLRDLPQWQDLDAVDAAGFRSIGDASTGHEHYINWDWIDDDVFLDPDYPESLVFAPQPDGTKQLVSAMFMLPMDYTLEDVPDYGGALMQWHVHGDLCFSENPSTRVVTGTKPVDGACRAPFVDVLAPMIHVWITPNECGPFAALEGIGGGQVREGETVLCDHAHGSA